MMKTTIAMSFFGILMCACTVPTERIVEVSSLAATTCATDSGSDAANDARDTGAEATADASEASVDAPPDSLSEAAADAASESPPPPPDASGAPYIRQWCQYANSGDGVLKQSCTLQQPVLAGSTIVAWANESNITGNPAGSGTPPPVTVTDSSGATYTQIDLIQDQPDWNATFAYVRNNVAAAQSLTVSSNYQTLEWQAILAVEVAGASASPVAGHGKNLQLNPGTTTDGLSAPTVSASSPALVLGFSQNVSDYLCAAPLAGTGMQAVAAVWNWNGVEGSENAPSVLLEAKTIGSGSVAPTFTATCTGQNWASFSVALVGQ